MSEILIAIALFVTAFVVLLGTLTSSAHAVRQAEDRVCAQQLAERLVESYRAMDSSAIPASDSGTLTADYQAHGTSTTTRFLYDVTATNVAVATGNITDLWVRVGWSADGVNRSVQLETAVPR